MQYSMSCHRKLWIYLCMCTQSLLYVIFLFSNVYVCVCVSSVVWKWTCCETEVVSAELSGHYSRCALQIHDSDTKSMLLFHLIN